MTRVRIALAVVILTALLPAVQIAIDLTSHPEQLRRRDDPISRFERHVAPLRDALRGERRVGYLGPEGGVDRNAHLYTLRYALAPVPVFDNVDEALVVADSVFDPRRIPPHLRVRRDFGDGLLLLEPAPR